MRTTSGRKDGETRGRVLDVVRALLADGHDDDAIAVVEKLVSRNEQLEQLLAQVRAPRNKREAIPGSQLDLFLEELRGAAKDDALSAANDKLSKTAKDNATKLLGDLTLEYNKARQAGITQEILEIAAASFSSN